MVAGIGTVRVRGIAASLAAPTFEMANWNCMLQAYCCTPQMSNQRMHAAGTLVAVYVPCMCHVFPVKTLTLLRTQAAFS
jgi:hypothetical protein